jgi:uncharacterized protein
MARPKKGFQWRRWNIVIHRDLGYLCVGLTFVFAISGIAVNHRADWNPNFKITHSTVPLTELGGYEPGTQAFVDHVLAQLELSEPVRGSFLRSPTEVDIFLEETTITVNLERSEAALETIKGRPILRETNFLHLNESKKWWTYMSDLYAVSLLILATTGMFMLKGKKGIKGRGKWLTAIGVAIPIAFLLLYF